MHADDSLEQGGVSIPPASAVFSISNSPKAMGAGGGDKTAPDEDVVMFGSSMNDSIDSKWQ